jgi:hypothetical protein
VGGNPRSPHVPLSSPLCLEPTTLASRPAEPGSGHGVARHSTTL